MYYNVTLCGYNERETREFFTIGTLVLYATIDYATEFADSVAKQMEPISWVLVRAHDCDGMSIDIVSEHGVTVTSYEFGPYNPLVVYHGDECHE